jgi:hypothetical protein
MRKLASIRIVNKIQPIPNADAIELAGVDGWEFVVKKGEFNIGDKGVYFEIDSFLNAKDERFQFLSKQFINFEGELGARIRTIRLRGQRSQGLLLPMTKFPELQNFEVGQDVTEILGVVKWEPAIPAQLAGDAIGLFPHYIFKTDAERCIAGETLIETDDINKPFKNIQEIVENKFSGKVKSFNHSTNTIEFCNVTDWSVIPNNDDWLEIVLKSGKKIYVTPNHKIWSETRNNYFNAENFSINEKIIISL